MGHSDLLGHHKPMEALDRAQGPLDRRGGKPLPFQVPLIGFDILTLDLVGLLDVALLQEGEIALKIATIRFLGMRRATPLNRKVAQILFKRLL